jgi:hypothetical protein
MDEQTKKPAKLKPKAQHLLEVMGKGYYPLDPEYIDEFIMRKARTEAEWAVAYGLLRVAWAIESAGKQIGGVDEWTGIMRIGAALDAMSVKKRENR